jgi:hypothetical protein
MNRFFALCFLLFSGIASVSAQVEKPYFQVFDISDETKIIKIETRDSFRVRKWNGVQLMVDMSIHLDGGSMDLLSMVIFDNRYAYEVDKQAENVLIRAKLARRDLAKLKYMGNFCVEKVTTTIYVPDGFEVRGNNEFVRKEDVLIVSDKR